MGAPAQHDMVHACVIKINGVAIQCIRHRILATEPIVSGLYITDIDFILNYFQIYIICNNVAILD